MQIVYLIKAKLSEQEHMLVRNTLAITPIIGVIVTQPRDIDTAQQFTDEILPMFGKSTATAIEAATEISRGADRPIAVVGDFGEAITENHVNCP